MKEKSVKYPFLTRDVKIYEQENGHKIVLAYKEGGMVNVSSWVKTGSINENDTNNGISHFLEHLMFKGTHKHPAGEFDHILEARGAIVNAATWKDYTFYYVTLPKGENNENFNLAIELHADMMTDPVVPDYEMGAPFNINDKTVTDKRERHVVIEEIRMRQDQPWSKVYNYTNHAMYTQHPYKRDVIGTPQIISQVSQETIMDYYKTFYSPNNITTIIVGDFDHETVLDRVIKGFDFKGRAKHINKINQPDKPTNSTIYVENKACLTSGFMMYGYLGAQAKDLKETIMLDMLAIILGDSASSRMYQNLIEKAEEQVFNMVGAEHYIFKDGSNFFLQANFIPEKKEKAIELLKQEVEKVKEFISENEFKKAKNKISVEFASETETVSSIGETIGYYMTVCDDLSLAADYLEEVEKITIEDLKDAASRYLNIDNATISVLIPES